jgi:hypothetical protein
MDLLIGVFLFGLGLLALALAVFLYFLPTAVAGLRSTRHGGAIFVFNLLLGWTFLFWVIALVWALADSRDE